MTEVAYEDVLKGLRALGVRRGGAVLVHSSLSSFGYVRGGAGAVIGALQEAVGDEGALLMPSFQRGLEYELVFRGCRFDLRNSPSEMGLITEVFRRSPGVVRSLHPTHSVAGWGRRARSFLEGHERCTVSCGWGSPFHRLCEAGGQILFLGVDHSCNTTLHFVENTSGAPTLSCKLFDPVVVDYEGREIVVPTYPHLPGLRRNYPKVEAVLKQAGAQREVRVGKATLRLVEAGEMWELVRDRIREDPLFLIDVFTPGPEDSVWSSEA